jgi:hypothetical protein
MHASNTEAYWQLPKKNCSSLAGQERKQNNMQASPQAWFCSSPGFLLVIRTQRVLDSRALDGAST